MQKHPEGKSFCLITISVSHYCEKARWALERLNISYNEERHVPLLHRLTTSQNGGKSVPLLVTNAGTFTDSTDILHYLEAIAPKSKCLYPTNNKLYHQVKKLEDLFNRQLGPCTRLWFYFYTIHNRELILKVWCDGVDPVEQELFAIVFPSIRAAILRGLNITTESVVSSHDKIKRIFETVNERLADGRSYLVGDNFSAADDLTFACLAAPTVLPAEYGVRLPQLDELPGEMAATINKFRESPAGEYALRLFHEERRSQ